LKCSELNIEISFATKIALFILLFLPNLLSAQNQKEKSNQVAIELNFAPVSFYLFDQTTSINTTNKYNFQVGVSFSYYKSVQKNSIGFTTGLNYGTKNFKQVNLDTNQVLFHHCSHYYSLLKIPLMIDYAYNFGHISAGGGLGLNLNYFLKGLCDYECVYNNGNTVDEFPDDLKFESFREFVAFISIEYLFQKSEFALEIRPFIAHDLSDPMFFSKGYYNLGKTMIGLNVVLKKYFTLNENRK
jgi:hypothetical protein